MEGKNSFDGTKIDGRQLCQEHVFFVHNQAKTRVTPDKILNRKQSCWKGMFIKKILSLNQK